MLKIIQLFAEGCQNLRETVKCLQNVMIKLTPESAMENLNEICDFLKYIRGGSSLSMPISIKKIRWTFMKYS